MNRTIDVAQWISRNFFLINIPIFIVFYARWFQLTPLVFSHHNDPNAAYIAGLIFLFLYSISATLWRSVKKPGARKAFLLICTFLLLAANYLFLDAYLPSVKDSTTCNKSTYYITYNHPFLDYNWEYNQVTKWKDFANYESDFFGYENIIGGEYKFVCDIERNELHIIDESLETLVYIDSEIAQYSFDHYARAELGNHYYFLSFQCNDWKPDTCGSYTLTLFECNKDYKSCNSLPISYTNKDSVYVQLKANELNGEISMHEYSTDNEILVFAYGKHPQCFVEGCEILEK